MTAISAAKDYIANHTLPIPPPVLGVAGDDVKLAFDKAKEQAAIVGENLVAFVPGISEETRKDLVNATLLAQLVAKKRVPEPKDLASMNAWYQAYFDVLANIGFAVQDTGFAEYTSAQDTFEASKELIAVAESLLLGAAAVAVISKALGALAQMDKDSPFITLYDREARHATTARFAATIVGDGFVQIIAFGLEATSDVTQVLFFKFRKNSTTLQSRSGKCSIDAEVLAAVRQDISKRLVGKAKKFVAGLPDL